MRRLLPPKSMAKVAKGEKVNLLYVIYYGAALAFPESRPATLSVLGEPLRLMTDQIAPRLFCMHPMIIRDIVTFVNLVVNPGAEDVTIVFEALAGIVSSQFYLPNIFAFQLEANNNTTRPLLSVKDSVELLRALDMHKGAYGLLFQEKDDLSQVARGCRDFLD